MGCAFRIRANFEISAVSAARPAPPQPGVLRERAKRFDKGDEVYFRGAAYNAQIGEKDKAFEYLEKSFQRHELWMSHLRVDPLLDSLRDDPRFPDLLKRVEAR